MPLGADRGLGVTLNRARGNLLERENLRKQLEEKQRLLEQLAHCDTLTGLPNRALLLDASEQAGSDAVL